MGQPADVVFRRNDLQLGKSFEDTAKNDRRQRTLDLVNQVRINLAHRDFALARFSQPHCITQPGHVALLALAGNDVE